MPQHPRYRADIDGLRALAVLAVVVFHAFPSLLPGGFIGVDIFFVLSGYLISGILFGSMEAGLFTYRDFYSRRVKRIFPALALVLAACLGLGWLVLLQDEFATFAKHLVSSVFFIQNLNLLHESGYFDSDSRLKPLLHLWSLSVEEQFYLLWPPLISIAFRRKWNIERIIVGLIAVSFALNLIRVGRHPASTFYQIQTRLWELMAGAWLTRSRQSVRWIRFSFPFWRELRSFGGLAIYAVGFAWIDESRAFPGLWAVVPVAGTLLLISSEGSRINKNLLSWRPLVWIGLISYPLYLWHWPLLAFTRILIPVVSSTRGLTLGVHLAVVVFSFALADLTFRFCETPIRKGRLPKGRVVTCLLFAFALLGVSGEWIRAKDGFPGRRAASRQPIPGLADRGSNSHTLVPCKKNLGITGVEWCLTNAPGDSPDVVVIGDSHALSLATGLALHYSPEGSGAKRLFILGTGDTLGLFGIGSIVGGQYSTHGMRNLDAAFQWAIKSGAKTIILASRGPFYLGGRGFGMESRSVGIRNLEGNTGQDPLSVYREGLTRTLKLLTTAGIRVVFIRDNPELGFLPLEACYARPVPFPGVKPLSPCALPRAEVDKRQRSYGTVVAEILHAFPQVRVFDPDDYLCDSRSCYAVLDGKLLYLDSNHLSAAGATLLGHHFDF